MIPKGHSEQIVQHLGGEGNGTTEFVVVPGAGHMVLLEKPAEVSSALTRLLRRVAELPARTAS
jgi:pimeloyl-ACP methyl ester carboxylesterase